jgi:hypothetical protein
VTAFVPMNASGTINCGDHHDFFTPVTSLAIKTAP